jgi:hypothetical protein
MQTLGDVSELHMYNTQNGNQFMIDVIQNAKSQEIEIMEDETVDK